MILYHLEHIETKFGGYIISLSNINLHNSSISDVPMRNKFVAWLGILLLFTAAVFGVYIWYTSPLGVFSYDEQTLLSKEFYGESDPAMEPLAQADRENLSAGELQELLPENLSVFSFNEDLTGDGNYEHLLYHRHEQSINESLREYGFETLILGLIIYQQRDGLLLPVLKIDSESILDEDGETIIDQVPSEHGYALRTSTFEDDRLYEAPTQVLILVMVDEEGKPASDEIAIYWSPDEQRYRIGSPGD